ncbi:hypothetical protein BCR39DRAFT_327793 [Naematelia encephala]|uniref:Uncharacterized protein n=1 Tax=Naematelia encephala TaxID=71784 RepID=A0A1Y2BDW8_9TREE|nr:hypothetical protein BCR39DRAFT_327793 [Naematelia encephala]
MVYIKSSSIASALIGAAALSATTSALPANKHTGPAPELGLGRVGVTELDAPKLHMARNQNGKSNMKEYPTQEMDLKRSWRGRPSKRGPWRQSPEDLIDVNLGSEDVDRHTGNLIDIQARHHRDVVVVEEPVHLHEHIHGHHGHHGDRVKVVHKRHSHDHDQVDVIEEPIYMHDHHRENEIIEPVGHVHQHLDRRHSGPSDVIVENGKHRYDTTIVDTGRHGTTVINNGAEHRNGDGDVLVEHKRTSGPGPAFLKRHSGTTIIDQGRHDGTVITEAGRHENVIMDDHRGHETTIVEDDHHHHDKRHSSSRILVLGDDRRYRDTEYYHGSHTRIEELGRPMYFGSGGDLDHVRMVTSVPWDYDYGYSRHGYYEKRRHSDKEGDVTVINTDHTHHNGDGDVTVVDNDSHHRHGSTTVVNNSKRRHGEDKHEHDEWRDVTVVNNNGGRHGHGDTTVVNNKREHGHDRHNDSKKSHSKRDTTMDGAPGYIDVTSPVFNSTTAQRIASLVLSTTNGTDSNSTFVLNASNNIRTQVYLVPINDSNFTNTTSMPTDSTTTSPIIVNLKLPIFVAATASVEPYCAAFDPSPESPQPLTVEPCTNGTDSHSSQNFLYDPSTGVISPDWTPSSASQQLLQSVGDSVDDDSDDTDSATNDDDVEAAANDDAATTITSTSMAFTSTTSTSMPSTSTTSTSTSTPIPSSSTSSTSMPTTSTSFESTTTTDPASTATSNPPPLISTGPQSSTDSSALSASGSNVTLIFSPANPSLASVESDSDADVDAQSDSTSEASDNSNSDSNSSDSDSSVDSTVAPLQRRSKAIRRDMTSAAQQPMTPPESWTAPYELC